MQYTIDLASGDYRAKAFFSHASEDKSVVEAVYERVLAEPNLAVWIDKYEILGGQGLLERIAVGMDESDKFVIFLSPVSINKPWVKRELRRAIMREIQGVDPDFIIPVLIGDIAAVPPFLEDKKYIALHKRTEGEWLPELIAAISGIRPTKEGGAQEENVVIRTEAEPGMPHVVRVVFEARFWAAKVAFGVTTFQDIVEARTEWPAHRGAAFTMDHKETHRHARGYAFRCDRPEIRPGYPVVFVLEFAPHTDALAAIEGFSHWDPE